MRTWNLPSWSQMYVYLGVAAALFLLLGLYLATLSFFSKRPTNLGVTHGYLANCPGSPNCVCTNYDFSTNQDHGIEPISFTGDVGTARRRLKRALETLPRIEIVTEEDNYLHAEATSFFFRFVDDVEFYINEQDHKIHFRSASRAGYSDLGANRARMESFRQAWKTAGE